MVFTSSLHSYLLSVCIWLSLDIRYVSLLFPGMASAPLEAVESNRVCWVRAHAALQRRGRNGVAANVSDIFRDDSIEREVEEAVNDHSALT